MEEDRLSLFSTLRGPVLIFAFVKKFVFIELMGCN